MGIDGGKSQQVTSFRGLPVRFLSLSDTGTLCFGYDGELYTMKPGASPQKVAVAIAADAKANRERVVPVTTGAREMAVAPSGKEIAFVARGDVFVTSVEGGVTKRVTTTPEEERGVGFSPTARRSSTPPSATAAGRSTRPAGRATRSPTSTPARS